MNKAKAMVGADCTPGGRQRSTPFTFPQVRAAV